MKANKKAKYPENKWLKKRIAKSGRTVTDIAQAIGYHRVIVSGTVNGHYKGQKVVPAIIKELGL
jgi:DNA transposition AAA+ family ATPase